MEKSGRMTALRKVTSFFTAIVVSVILAGCANPMASASAKSANANLATLSLSVSGTAVTISPAFSADTVTYVATVANSADSVTVSASAAETAAVVTGTGAKSLVVGSNTASVTVTAPDGSTTKTYTITITRANALASSDASLSSLKVGDATFASPTTGSALSVDVANTVSSIAVVATPSNSGAIASISGNTSLVVGNNTVTVTVVAADGTTATYTVTVCRHGLTLTSPTAGTAITSSSFTLTGGYYGSIAPAISIKFAGLDAVTATVDSAAKTWSATINGSSVTNGEGKTLTVTASWGDADSFTFAGTYTFAGSTVSTARAVFITSPIAQSTVSTPTISVSGAYAGDSAPSSITVYFGLSTSIATIDSSTHTWSAEITPSGVAKTTSVCAMAVGAWNGESVYAYRSFAWTGTSDEGHTVSGTLSFPWKSLTSDTDLFIYTVPTTSDNSIATYNAKLGSSTSFSYKLENVADGTYRISAFTHAGDWSFVSGTSCYQWGVITITVNGGDITGQDFALLSPSGSAAQTIRGTITLPTDATFASTSCIAVLLKPTSTDDVIASANIPITSSCSYSLVAPPGSYRIQAYVNDGNWVWESAELYANWSAASVTVDSANLTGIDFALSKQ